MSQTVVWTELFMSTSLGEGKQLKTVEKTIGKHITISRMISHDLYILNKRKLNYAPLNLERRGF